MQLAVLLFVALVLGPFVARAQCPEECRCEDTDLGKKVKCSDRKDVFPQGKHDAFKILDISFNFISTLDERVFHDNQLLKLISLNISHNKLDSIDENAFYLMSDLKILDLSHNELTHIEPSVLKPLSQNLEELYLNNNPLLRLADRFVFSRLTLLDLNYCKQKSLPDNFLSDVKSLIHLGLAANSIESIDQNLAEASQLKSLSTLNLQRNMITALNDQLLLKQDLDIELSDNPWICDCQFLGLIALNEQRFNPALKCNGPDEVKGRDASKKLAEERNCNSGSSTVKSSLLTFGVISMLACLLLAW